MDGFKGPDFGSHIQVRATEHWYGHLFIYRDDDPADIYVLVVGKPPRMGIAGWIPGVHGKRAEFWMEMNRTDGGCFWIPQSALEDMDDLFSGGFE
jgi:hypothetical protein